jgi:hypothetical protein
MPLGKISKKQLMKAYETLKELSQALNDEEKVLELSNKFYHLIPSTRNVPIKNEEVCLGEENKDLQGKHRTSSILNYFFFPG